MSALRIAALPETEVTLCPRLGVTLEGGVWVGRLSQVRPGAVLTRIKGLARFLAEGGNQVRYSIEPGGDPDALGVWLNGLVTAALVHQRGELPLHGATLVPPGGEAAVAIVGDSGAGKSTLAYALIERGWSLLNDDLSRVTASGSGVIAWPGREGLRLCDEACRYFGLDAADLRPVAGDRRKGLAKVSAFASPVPLRAIVEIDRSADAGPQALEGAEAAALLSRNTQRLVFVRPLGMLGAHFGMAARTAAACSVLRLVRTAPARETADEVNLLCRRLLVG